MSDLPTQADFAHALQAATERLFMHRKAMKRVAVRIGYWPQGMVISANIPARNAEELEASLPVREILWPEVANLTRARMIGIVDEVCAPLYPALGLTQSEARGT